MGVALRGRIKFNEGLSTEQEIDWDTGRTTYVTSNKTLTLMSTGSGFIPVENLQSLKIFFDDFHAATLASDNDARLYELEVYIGDSGNYLSDAIEFNDSVLTTKAWNSSRYDGKQLQGTAVNAFNVNNGDVSYGNTPVVSNYSKNIYLGERIIGHGESFTDEVDDSSLLNYPGFSYITVKEYLTVNDDLSVTRHSVIGDIPDKPGKPGTNNRIKKGWYKAWYDDFPIRSSVKLKFFDEKLETSLDNSYNIYFNAGQLKKLIHIRELDTGSAAAGS